MSSLVIVAIPAEDDYVNKISSEKIAHMTLLFLGEVNQVKNFSEILNFVRHAAGRSLMRFGLEVDRRAVLGEDEADVLLFSKSKWSGYETINEFRSYLLKDDNIRVAYDSIEQFPEWVPHLTLGYPDSPAKPDERDYPGINYVNFDRIAVWFGEFEGIEFPLKAPDWGLDVAMSDVTITEGKLAVEDILEHAGVKGMRWGVRNESPRMTPRRATKIGGQAAREKYKQERAAGKSHGQAREAAKREKVAVARQVHKEARAERKAAQPKGEQTKRGRFAAWVKEVSFAANINSPESLAVVHKVAATRSAHDLVKINKKPEYRRAQRRGTFHNPDDPTTIKYREEVSKMYQKNLNDVANEIHGASPGGRKIEVVESTDYPNQPYGFELVLRKGEVKHADETAIMKVHFVFDEDGTIIGFELVDDTLAQGELAVDDILEHFGVKGMQWGVRRKATVGPEEVIVRDSRVPGSKRQVAKGGRGHPSVSEATRSREIGRIGQKSGTRALTNKQLEEYNRRLNLEQNFKRLQYQDLNPGQKFVKFILGQSQKSAAQAGNEEATKRIKAKLATIAVAAA